MSITSGVISWPFLISNNEIILTRFVRRLFSSDLLGIFIPLPLAFSISLVDLINDENWSLSNATISSGDGAFRESLKCLSTIFAPKLTAPKDIDQPILWSENPTGILNSFFNVKIAFRFVSSGLVG